MDSVAVSKAIEEVLNRLSECPICQENLVDYLDANTLEILYRFIGEVEYERHRAN